MLVELSVVEQRYHAVMEVLSAGAPVVEVAERYGVSRKTVHAWIRRYRTDGLPGLVDRSHRPHHHPWQLAADIEARICELRRSHPRWGPRRLGHELARAGVTPVPSRSSIYRTLVRHHLITPQPRKRPRSDYRRWERPGPMQLWQLDIMGSVFVTDPAATGGVREVKLVSGIDDHSRYCVIAAVVERATSRAVCAAFLAALARFGAPEQVLTDNGIQFTSRFRPRAPEVWFDVICRRNGIDHLLTKVRSPTTTGKIERWHQSIQTELLDDHDPFDTRAASRRGRGRGATRAPAVAAPMAGGHRAPPSTSRPRTSTAAPRARKGAHAATTNAVARRIRGGSGESVRGSTGRSGSGRSSSAIKARVAGVFAPVRAADRHPGARCALTRVS
jgi:transposase InsO family protein